MVGGSLRVLPASSTTKKTGHHDIAKILLKVALNTKNQIKSIKQKPSSREVRVADFGQQREIALNTHLALRCLDTPLY